MPDGFDFKIAKNSELSHNLSNSKYEEVDLKPNEFIVCSFKPKMISEHLNVTLFSYRFLKIFLLATDI